MANNCDKCGEHCVDCECNKEWWETEEGKQSLLDQLNQRFYFHKDGTITEREHERMEKQV